MKRFLLIGLLFLGLDSSVSYAQSRGTHRDATYQDDIYYNSEDAKKDAEIEAKEAKKRQAYERENEHSYTSSGGDASDGGDNKNYNRSYESDDEGYIDYDDDDYYYSNRIRRFNNNPYWGFGYYTPYYNPYWYDPFYGPYSYGPTVSLSFGWGNPYWGWNTWYGYPGFYSCWNYPQYGYGWGGGYWNGYNNGFYDGYYAGAYGGYYRNVTYGPRTSLHRGAATGVRRGVGFNNNVQPSSGPRPQLRQSVDNNTVVENPGRPMRSASDRNAIEYRGGGNEAVQAPATNRFENSAMQAEPQKEMSRRSRFFNNSEAGSGVEDARSVTPQREMSRRNRFFNNNQAGSGVENARPADRPQYNEGKRAQGFEQQAPVMRAQPNSERQNYQRAQPSYEAPRMNAPNYSAPQRGGGNFGGGSFGGGHRR